MYDEKLALRSGVNSVSLNGPNSIAENVPVTLKMPQRGHSTRYMSGFLFEVKTTFTGASQTQHLWRCLPNEDERYMGRIISKNAMCSYSIRHMQSSSPSLHSPPSIWLAGARASDEVLSCSLSLKAAARSLLWFRLTLPLVHQ